MSKGIVSQKTGGGVRGAVSSVGCWVQPNLVSTYFIDLDHCMAEKSLRPYIPRHLRPRNHAFVCGSWSTSGEAPKNGPRRNLRGKKDGWYSLSHIHANLLHESVRTMSPSDRGERKCHVQKLTRRQTCCPTIRSTFWRQDVLEKDAHPQAGKESEVGCLLIA